MKHHSKSSFRELYSIIFSADLIKCLGFYEFTPFGTRVLSAKTTLPTPFTTRYETNFKEIKVSSSARDLKYPQYNPRSPQIKDKTVMNRKVTTSEYLNNLAMTNRLTDNDVRDVETRKTIANDKNLKKVRITSERIKISAKKIRWYDMKPRLLTNHYYRNNFAINFVRRKDHPLITSELLKAPVRVKSSSCRPSITFNRAIFSAKPIKSKMSKYCNL